MTIKTMISLRLLAIVLLGFSGLVGCTTTPSWLQPFSTTPAEVSLPADASASQLYEQALRLGYQANSQGLRDAHPFLQRAAQQDHVGAQYLLGMNYLLGRGVTKDEALAYRWLEPAAEAGHASAQYFLAELLINGRGVSTEKAWGVQWLERSANRNEKASQLALGIAFASGLGGITDEYLAVEWLIRARNQGSPEALQLLTKLSAKLVDVDWQILERRAKRPLPSVLAKPEQASIRFVQLVLNRHGYRAGPEDGIEGARTRAAIGRFSASQEVSLVDISEPLLQRLRALQRQDETG
ncbi:MAG: SEL1-like repeat protein [Halopseudomonas sp.]